MRGLGIWVAMVWVVYAVLLAVLVAVGSLLLPRHSPQPERGGACVATPAIRTLHTYRVTVTAYAPGDGSGTRTYLGTRVRPGVLAVSHDLRSLLGHRVHLAGIGAYTGTYVVEDLMHARWRAKVDVWLPSHAEARRFGVRDGVLTWDSVRSQ